MKIVTDSAADLLPQEAETLGITVAPLHIQFPQEEVDSDQISPDEFYTRLRELGSQIPTTSQPSGGKFARIYKSLQCDCRQEILSVHISSGLSGTIEAARSGACQDPDVDVTLVDTLTLSGGQRFQVLAAAQDAQAGLKKQDIIEHLVSIREATEVAFTLDTLTYLARGGRIGRVQALAGTLLKLKPVISVDKKDGRYNSSGKERTLSKAMERVVDHHFKAFGGDTPVWVAIMHGQFLEQAEALAQQVRERLNVARLDVLQISPVLGVHTGPGVVGAAVVPLDVMNG